MGQMPIDGSFDSGKMALGAKAATVPSTMTVTWNWTTIGRLPMVVPITFRIGYCCAVPEITSRATFARSRACGERIRDAAICMAKDQHETKRTQTQAGLPLQTHPQVHPVENLGRFPGMSGLDRILVYAAWGHLYRVRSGGPGLLGPPLPPVGFCRRARGLDSEMLGTNCSAIENDDA